MLKRKMLRDIRNNISQYITIFLMVLIGIFAYTGIKAYMLGMDKSAKIYYEENNLQDMDLYGEFDDDDIEEISKMKHVENVSGKISLPSLASHKDNKLSIYYINNNDVSKFYVIDGKKFDIDEKGLWLDSYYADLNNIKVGDKITINYEGYEFKKKVVGLIDVPDLVYYVKDDSEVFPAHKSYGFVYMSVNALDKEIFTKLSGKELDDYEKYIRYSSLLIDLDSKDNRKTFKEKIIELDNVNACFNSEDLLSYDSYQREMDEGKTYVGVFSGLFIFIALLSVVTTMTRVVRKDRTIIGTLKALGYSDIRIAIHYLSYGVFLSIIAAVIGIVLGYFLMGNFFVKMEMEYYVVPNPKAYIDSSTYLVAILVILGVVIATLLSTYKVLIKNAAETLRVERPNVKTTKVNIIERKLFKHLSFSSRWNIRDILRSKARTIMGLVGIVGCMILLVAATGMNDTMKNYLNLEFNIINNYEYKLNLSNYGEDALKELKDKYGDNTSKSQLIEFKYNDDIISNNIFVNDSNSSYRIVDSNDKEIKLKDDGIYITRKLADKYNLKVGDTIEWRILGTNKYYISPIIGLSKDPQNQNIVMTKEYYESLDLEYIPDSLYTNKKVNVGKHIDGVGSIQSIDDISKGINNMLSTMMAMIFLIIFIAILLGTVIIYNMGILSFTEKNYQFATLKVLGFSDKKISKIFIEQNLWVAILAIVIGLPLGYYTLSYIFYAALGDAYDFEAYISLLSYVLSAIGTFVMTMLVSIYLTRKIKKIDMVTSLKGNE